jgi:hypothetical protein
VILPSRPLKTIFLFWKKLGLFFVKYLRFFVVLDKKLLPLEFANKRAKYVRNRLAAKVLQHGRQVIVKCQAQYYNLLAQVLNNIKAFKPLLS